MSNLYTKKHAYIRMLDVLIHITHPHLSLSYAVGRGLAEGLSGVRILENRPAEEHLLIESDGALIKAIDITASREIGIAKALFDWLIYR